MTSSLMSCELFADRLADFLERDVDESTRAGMEAHALSCAECGALLADLRTLRIDAANLPPLVPSRDLWAGIAARIETPVVELKNGGSAEVWNAASRRRARIWTGLAAAGLVAITATVTRELTKRSDNVIAPPVHVAATPSEKKDTVAAVAAVSPAPAPVPAARVASPKPASVSLVANRPSAQQTYDEEIARLRVVVNRRRPQLDSATVAVIEHNLKVIDDAIAQCKQALRKDPASRFLMESLNDAMDNKVQLLRTAAVLPSRM
jgi:hypothetical protein